MSERFGTLHEMIDFAKKKRPVKRKARSARHNGAASSRLIINPIKAEPITSRRAILKHIKEVYE